jgi:hypothetical protein
MRRRTRRWLISGVLAVVVGTGGVVAQRQRRGDEWTIVARGVALKALGDGTGQTFWEALRSDLHLGPGTDKVEFDADIERLSREDRLPLPYRFELTNEVSGVRPSLRPYDLVHLPEELQKAVSQFLSAPHIQLTTSDVVAPNMDFSIEVHNDSAVSVAEGGDVVETEVTVGDRRYMERRPLAGGTSTYAISQRSATSVVLSSEWMRSLLDIAAMTEFDAQVSSSHTTWVADSGSFVTVNGELRSFVSVRSAMEPSTWNVRILQPGEAGAVSVAADIPAWAIGKPLS